MISSMPSSTEVTASPRLRLRGKRTIDLSMFSKLSKEQAGHIRHFHNLASQPLNEWPHMASQEPLQEFLDAFRYQLATMAYATGVAHYHRLPALRGPLKKLMRDLIEKMLHRSVWGYWFTTSLGGNRLDPSLTEYRKPWADPVVKENIMYSGHLLLMVSLYAMLFDDDEFEQPNSITFKWDPLFFGFGTESFYYDTKTLQQAIINEMESNGWMGVCCEPNAVFVVCNQFPIIAMRYNDVRWGTKTVSKVLDRYAEAWRQKGGFSGKNGFYRDMWLVKQDSHIDANDFGFSAWANAFMNTWNADYVRYHYKIQAEGFIVKAVSDDQPYTVLNPPLVAQAFRNIAMDQVDDLDVAKTQIEALKQAKELAMIRKAPSHPYTKPILGYVMQCLSELGEEGDLDGLLQYADRHLNPTWEKGGLYYPRNDRPMDSDCNWTHVSPFCGNAAIGYARLNTNNGQKDMWENPWTRTGGSQLPYVDKVDLSDDVDFLRAVWSEEQKALIITLRTWHEEMRRSIEIRANQLPKGLWEVSINGEVVLQENLTTGGSITLPLEVGFEEMDIVLAQIDNP